MQPEAKKLGVLLIEAGLITEAQLQETLRHQRISGGRLGSTLVALGVINEDSLMDFLARKTGVPRLDVKHLEIPAGVLQRIPRRLAEQMTILPVAVKEPRSLVLAMADPLDLNAVDSARFASDMTIQPVVASHKALCQAIATHYDHLESWATHPLALDVSPAPLPVETRGPEAPGGPGEGANDPFFSLAPADASSPFSFFPDPKAQVPVAPAPAPSAIVHSRSAMSETARALDSYGTRALVLGLIRMLQRRGILGQDELQRFLHNLVANREIDPDK